MEYKTSLWNGFKRLDFSFNGRSAILVLPEAPDAGRHFLIKTEYFGAFPGLEVEMLKRGWHLAYIENLNRWGVVEDQDMRAEFCRFLHSEFGLAERCVPVGMSCGGLHAVCFASRHPECVSALYLDAPVMNLLSYPMGFGKAAYDPKVWDEVKRAYGIDETGILSFRQHPIDRMEPLYANRIPVLMVYGDSDDMVPYPENGALLEAEYRARGLEIEVYGKPGCGHHPHGLADSSPLIRFILAHAD